MAKIKNKQRLLSTTMKTKFKGNYRYFTPSSYELTVVVDCSDISLFAERAVRSCLAQTFPGYSIKIFLCSSKPKSKFRNILKNYFGQVDFLQITAPISFFKKLYFILNHVRSQNFLWLDANDFISDFMLLTQTIFLSDNPESQGVTVDYWSIKPFSDKKTSRITNCNPSYFSGIMWKKEALLLYLDKLQKKMVQNEKLFFRNAKKELKLGHIPIAFLRKTDK